MAGFNLETQGGIVALLKPLPQPLEPKILTDLRIGATLTCSLISNSTDNDLGNAEQ